MPSSDFVPLASGVGTAAAPFRPLAEPAPPSEPAAPPPPVETRPPRPEDDPAWHAGFTAGRAAAQVDVDAMAATLARSIEQLATFQRNLRSRYERELLLVALGVARKVVQQELQERPEIWLGMIRNAITQAVDRERLVIHVPPQLAALVTEKAPTLRAGLDDLRELVVVADASLPPGGCVVESRWGEVDLSVDTQLDAAEQALLRAER